MTCIAAIVDIDGSVYMGGDSFIGGERTHLLMSATENKIFKMKLYFQDAPTEEMIFGFAGTIRPCQLVKYNLELDLVRKPIENNMEYLINTLVPEIKKIHKKHGVVADEDGIDMSESAFLLGWRKNLYYIDDDYGVYESSTKYAAIGSGEDLAFGSLRSTNESSLPEKRIMAALEAAQANGNFVREPFYVEHI